jgi:hypothetical protein
VVQQAGKVSRLEQFVSPPPLRVLGYASYCTWPRKARHIVGATGDICLATHVGRIKLV